MPVIRVENVTVRVGGIVALDGVSVNVNAREIFGLVGPNGAGKTTLLNVISGVVPASKGRVFFEGNDITRIPLHRRVGIGIGRTFQGGELFADLTVLENLLLGRHHLMKAGVLQAGLFFGSARQEEYRHRQAIEEAVDFFELERYRKSAVGVLPHGIQKIVGVARAICSEPKLLLLDEVASGLNTQEKEDLSRFLLRLKHTRPITMIWVEHDVRLVSELADSVTVLDHGRAVISGTAEEALRNPKVRAVFLGATRNQDVAGGARSTAEQST